MGAGSQVQRCRCAPCQTAVPPDQSLGKATGPVLLLACLACFPRGGGLAAPGAPPTSPLIRASLAVGTASDGLGPKGQAFCLWREAGVLPLTAGAPQTCSR